MSLSFLETQDKIQLALHTFQASQEKTIALFLGGVESHGGWYGDSLAFLANSGVTAYFLDRRGSGSSGGRRGDLRNSETLYSDLEEVTRWIQKKHPNTPMVLGAISWGAKPALYFWFRAKNHPFKKLILVTPGIFRKVDLSRGEKFLAVAANMAAPFLTFRVPILTEHFTANQERLKFIATDPDRIRRVSARFLKTTFLMDRSLMRFRGIFPQPIHLFTAGHENIVDNDRNLEFINKHFFDIHIHRYPESFHTLEFEDEPAFKRDLTQAVLEGVES